MVDKSSGPRPIVVEHVLTRCCIWLGNRLTDSMLSSHPTLERRWSVRVAKAKARGTPRASARPLWLTFRTPILWGLTEQFAAADTGYIHSRAITIDHTKVPNTDQSNFPVLISGTNSYLATTSNGGYVTNANGYDMSSLPTRRAMCWPMARTATPGMRKAKSSLQTV